MAAPKEATVAEAIAATLKAYGVRRIFGVPGGGSSLPLLAAAAAHGIDFVLTRHETAATIMAAVTGELSGTPGVVLTTKGPGIANAMNGLAYAFLDRAPALVIAEGFETHYGYMSHQAIDQRALTRPVVKGSLRIDGAEDTAGFSSLLDLALAEPRGPVYAEITPKGANAVLASGPSPTLRNFDTGAPDEGAVAEARALLAAAKRPVVVAGLQTVRSPADATALKALVDDLGCPCFPTYKAKGVLADDDPRAIGLFVGGAGEADLVGRADLIVLFGADPVEFAIQPWRYKAPAIDISRYPYDRHYLKPAVTILGGLPAAAERLAGAHRKGAWTATELAEMRKALLDKLAIRSGGPITAQHVVEAAVAAAPEGTRIAVDAGAHMIPVMAFWQARAANDVLISNGLATMGFALPAAIASALHEPDRPVIAFTGDGGLSMCMGELATAAQRGCRLVVVVFNDSALSLIALKQARTGYESKGVSFSEVDFAAAAHAAGCKSWRVTEPAGIETAIRQALATGGPTLVDVVIDPSGYFDQVKALRG